VKKNQVTHRLAVNMSTVLHRQHFDSPPKSVRKGARFWGFHHSRFCGVLGKNPSIPLDSMSFGGS
jgi:hypothetical protein